MLSSGTDALTWVRSSACADQYCVEVAAVGDHVAVRDSKNTDQPYLSFPVADWNGFVEALAAGEVTVA